MFYLYVCGEVEKRLLIMYIEYCNQCSRLCVTTKLTVALEKELRKLMETSLERPVDRDILILPV